MSEAMSRREDTISERKLSVGIVGCPLIVYTDLDTSFWGSRRNRRHAKLGMTTFTPGRPHIGPTQANRKGQQGKPRSRWCATLGACDQLVEWLKPLNGPEWMDEAQFAQLPDDLTLRELRYQVHRQGFRAKTIILVTTLIHAEHDSAEALSALDFARWGIETNLAHLKTTMGLDVLTCKTVEGVLKELIVFA
jgi:Transposase DDE domain